MRKRLGQKCRYLDNLSFQQLTKASTKQRSAALYMVIDVQFRITIELF